MNHVHVRICFVIGLACAPSWSFAQSSGASSNAAALGWGYQGYPAPSPAPGLGGGFAGGFAGGYGGPYAQTPGVGFPGDPNSMMDPKNRELAAYMREAKEWAEREPEDDESRKKKADENELWRGRSTVLLSLKNQLSPQEYDKIRSYVSPPSLSEDSELQSRLSHARRTYFLRQNGMSSQAAEAQAKRTAGLFGSFGNFGETHRRETLEKQPPNAYSFLVLEKKQNEARIEAEIAQLDRNIKPESQTLYGALDFDLYDSGQSKRARSFQDFLNLATKLSNDIGIKKAKQSSATQCSALETSSGDEDDRTVVEELSHLWYLDRAVSDDISEFVVKLEKDKEFERETRQAYKDVLEEIKQFGEVRVNIAKLRLLKFLEEERISKVEVVSRLKNIGPSTKRASRTVSPELEGKVVVDHNLISLALEQVGANQPYDSQLYNKLILRLRSLESCAAKINPALKARLVANRNRNASFGIQLAVKDCTKERGLTQFDQVEETDDTILRTLLQRVNLQELLSQDPDTFLELWTSTGAGDKEALQELLKSQAKKYGLEWLGTKKQTNTYTDSQAFEAFKSKENVAEVITLVESELQKIPNVLAMPAESDDAAKNAILTVGKLSETFAARWAKTVVAAQQENPSKFFQINVLQSDRVFERQVPTEIEVLYTDADGKRARVLLEKPKPKASERTDE